MQTPLIYKTIPTQFVFLVSKDGTLNITQVSDVPKELKFKSEKEARKYIDKYDVQL